MPSRQEEDSQGRGGLAAWGSRAAAAFLEAQGPDDVRWLPGVLAVPHGQGRAAFRYLDPFERVAAHVASILGLCGHADQADAGQIADHNAEGPNDALARTAAEAAVLEPDRPSSFAKVTFV